MLKPYFKSLETQHEDEMVRMEREKHLFNIIKYVFPDISLEVDVEYSFSSFGSGTIRVFFYLPDIRKASPSKKNIILRTKAKMLAGLEEIVGRKPKRFFREDDGRFAYKADAARVYLDKDTGKLFEDKHGTYDVILLLENVPEPQCKITRVKEEREVYQAVCKDTGEVVK